MQNDPYKISTVEDWKALAAAVNNGEDYENTYFLQTASLDMTGVNELVPIGNLSKPFAGNYEGGGYTISNATISGIIDEDKYAVAGLFGALTGKGSISNLIVTKVTVTANSQNGVWNFAFAGGLLAVAEDCTVTDCSVSNSKITATDTEGDTFAGALVGYAQADKDENTVFIRCASESNDVNATGYAGGFVGAIANDDGNNQGTLNFTDCYSANNKSAAGKQNYARAGAFLGESQGGNISLANCFVYKCSADVTGSTGGKAGLFTADTSNGKVNATNTYYYDIYSLEVNANSAQSKTADEMKSLASTLGDPFSQGSDYPILLHPINLVVSIDDWAYGETANTPIITGNSGNGSVTYQYKGKESEDNQYSTTVPANVGVYTVKASVVSTGTHKAGEASADFKITKATPTVTAPTAKTGLKYNAAAQELINAGSTQDGTLSYALGDNSATAPTSGYGTTIPTGTDEGTYYVWYKVSGDINHSDIAAKCIQFTIELESYTITYSGLENSSGAEGNPTSYTMKSDAITLNNPKRNGYRFDGWTGTDLTAKTHTVTIAKGSTGNRSYTANWTHVYAVTAENFPDENLRGKLKEIFEVTGDDNEFFIVYETLEQITELDVSGAGISDLSGLEKFTSLTSLNVSGNNLNNPDFAKLPNLTYLDVHNCGLSNLDVSALTALEYLDCGANYLRELDLTANGALTYFDGTAQTLSNTLTGLQLGNLYLFDFAALLEKPENIDSVNNAARFEDFIATFTPDQPSAITYKYDVGTSAGLLEVTLSSVSFTTAAIEITNAAISNHVGKVGEEFSSELISSATPAAIIFEWLIDGLPKGLSFDVDEKIISGIPNESGDFELEIIASAGGMFDNRTVMLTIEPADVEPVSPDIEPESLDITPTSPDLAVINAEDFSSLGKVGENYSATFMAMPEEIYSWSVEGLPEGLSYSGSENTLTINGEPAEAGIFALIITAQNEEHNGTLRVSVIISPADKPDDNPDEPGGDDNPENPDTPADDSSQKIINVITEILTTGDVSTIEEIDTIDLSSMDISDLSVVVENLTGLESLDCSGNDIETIKLTVSKNLRYLNCSNNNTKTLDVSNSPLLVVLDCSENDLDELNVENNPDLVSLNCADNNLENLNLQNNSRLTLLGYWNNNFAALDLSAFTELYGLFEASAENRRDFNASDCANQKVHGLRIENTGGLYHANLGSCIRRGRGGALSASDEVETPIPIESYNEAAG